MLSPRFTDVNQQDFAPARSGFRRPLVRWIGMLWMAFSVAAAPVELNLGRNFRWGAAGLSTAPGKAAGLRFEAHRPAGSEAVEWQVRLRGPTEDPKSADFVLRFPKASPVSLHWNRGSHAEPADFQPLSETLTAGKPVVLESFGGRSSDGVLPYFNLAGEGGGLIVAVGWSGDWRATFERQADGRVRVTAGLKHARLQPAPGEELRLPSVLLLPYRGDWLAGQNRFRRLLRDAFTPTNHPPMELMPVAASVHGMIGFNDTTETNLVSLARDVAALKLPIDTYWLDAGWNTAGFPHGQGNPFADAARFPHGLAPVGAAARAGGMRFLMWFEPERVMRGTWLDREHPDWLLRPAGTPEALRYQEKDGFRILDLGRTEARHWAVETVTREIQSTGVAIYRQDFNAYPAWFWSGGVSADEAALREVRYINGLYEFLDELVRRNPGLILDNCASGGRRLDFELMRRSVVLWRSDSCWGEKPFPRNVQAMSHGLSHWIPLHGLGATGTDDLSLRSGMGACASFPINFRDPAAVTALRRHLQRYLPLRHLFTADYYPLTDWTTQESEWLAFQYHDPQTGEGLVQAFRGPSGATDRLVVKLRGLDPKRRYRLTDWDNSGEAPVRTGADLAAQGVEFLATPNAGTARVLHYTRVPR